MRCLCCFQQCILEQVHVELNLPAVDIILPVGISFYTFQALSYTADYMGTFPQGGAFGSNCYICIYGL